MKALFFTFLFFYSISTFAQDKIYIVTEQFTGGGNTSIDKIIVTNPEGVTTTFDITHFLDDVEAHDSDFNKILNDVIS